MIYIYIHTHILINKENQKKKKKKRKYKFKESKNSLINASTVQLANLIANWETSREQWFVL